MVQKMVGKLRNTLGYF